MTSPVEVLRSLDEALDEYRLDDVRCIIDDIDPSLFSPRDSARMLGSIRRKRLFPELEKTAALFSLGGAETSTVRRQWAQALLDQGRIGQGLAALKAMLSSVSEDSREGPEVRGLIGRAYKQRFVDEADPEDLRRAVLAYRGDWEYARERWHGINLVALLKRAQRDGLDPGVPDDAEQIAREVLDTIDCGDEPAVWDMATAMEAAVALGDHRRSVAWVKVYAPSPAADAFELGATLRQLREVWQLEGTALGAKLIPVLEYELLQRQDARHLPSHEAANPEGFEAVYGQEGYTYFQWLDTMQASCRAIARVFETASGKPCGTGFLVRGGDLDAAWGDDIVFVTNSHVMSDDAADKSPLRPGQGSAEFTRVEGRPKIELGPLLFRSPRVELDISVCRITPPPGIGPVKTTIYRPAMGDDTQRIYVAGHPNGAELAISLYDNKLVGYVEPYVHYKSPTDGGHSGSPVFNRAFSAFALHHRARAELQANEGVLFEFIVQARGG